MKKELKQYKVRVNLFATYEFSVAGEDQDHARECAENEADIRIEHHGIDDYALESEIIK